MRRLYPARLLEVRGTDTLEVELDLGFNVYTRQKIRLFGVASAGKDVDVKLVLTELCKDGLIVEPIITKRAKLGRVLGWAYLSNDTGEPTLNINEALVDQELASSFQVQDEDEDE
jgi:hypothetical protein